MVKEPISPLYYYFVSALFVVCVVLAVYNRKRILMPSLVLILVGIVCNALAIFSNGGFMPVLTSNPAMIAKISQKPHHIFSTSETKFKPLIDRFDIDLIEGTSSIGDFLIVAGVIAMVTLMVFTRGSPSPKKKREKLV